MTSNATTQTEALLLTETKEGIATLTLNRPGQFNALSRALIDELQSIFDRLAADPTVRVVVLAANGRGFCAGHDLKEIRALGSVQEVESLFARCSRMMMTITKLPQPRALGEQGMRVAVHYQSARAGAEAVAADVQAAGGEAVLLQADLRDRTQARALLDRAAAALGGLDLLVPSAASFERGGLEDADDDDWDQTLALNLGAPFALAQRAAPLLRAARGSIVFVTCISRLAPYRDYLAYQVSKAALHQMMRVLALELAPQVRVNAVAPGSVLPPEGWSEVRLAALRARIPLGRTGSARDVADTVVHLARSEWITGTEIPVDGGRHLA